MKKIICVALLCSSNTLSWASVIAKDCGYVVLPKDTADTKFSSFKAINSRGLAVGYGARKNKIIGFVFNYYTQSVKHIIDNFYPTEINDNNKIIGIDLSSPNNILKQCTLTTDHYNLSSIEGAERVYSAPNVIMN